MTGRSTEIQSSRDRVSCINDWSTGHDSGSRCARSRSKMTSNVIPGRSTSPAWIRTRGPGPAGKKAQRGLHPGLDKGLGADHRADQQEPQVAKTYCFLASHVSGETNAVTVNRGDARRGDGHLRLDHLPAHQGARGDRRPGQDPGRARNLRPASIEEIWKFWGNAKKFAAFNTKTLVSKKANAVVARQMKMLFGTPDEEEPAA